MSLAPQIDVTKYDHLHTEGTISLVDVRFTDHDDHTWRVLLPAAQAKTLSAQLLWVGMSIEPEDDRC